MGRAKAFDKANRKERIVQAAIKCFIKHGVADTRMSEVAEKAGVDQPLIHYYFPSLDALYAEVIQSVLDHLKTEVMAGLTKGAADPAEALLQYVRTYFRWAEKNPGIFSLWLYFYYLASFQPKFIATNQLIRETGRERIASILYNGIEKKIFTLPKTVDVSSAALGIQGIITGNVVMASTEGPSTDWSKFSDSAVQLSFLLCGRTAPPS